MENAAASALLEAPTVWELVRTRAELSGDRPLLLEPSGRRVGFATPGVVSPSQGYQ